MLLAAWLISSIVERDGAGRTRPALVAATWGWATASVQASHQPRGGRHILALVGRVIEGVGGQPLERTGEPLLTELEGRQIALVVGCDDAREGVLLVVGGVKRGVRPGEFALGLGDVLRRPLDQIDVDPDDRRHDQHRRD
jgi:hypothetical protein